jgi:hypothetical protein
VNDKPAEDLPTIRLTLRTLPGYGPFIVRVRRLLKSLLRAHGFRCLSLEEVKDECASDDSGGEGPKDV